MKINLTKYLLSTTIAFNNSPTWKLDADGKIEMKDGNPVYVDASGREMVVKHDTISNLNGEAKGHRERAEAAEAKLKAYEGLDPTAAREAIEKLSKIDDKKLLDAGEVDKLRQQIHNDFAKKLEDSDNAAKAAKSELDNMRINLVFSSSEFVREQIAVPIDMFEASFRNNFKVEDGKVVAYDKSGNRLLSQKSSGEYASPEEALELLVAAHPQKDTILKAAVGNGSGNNGNGGNRSTIQRTVTRKAFDALTPAEKASTAAKARTGEIVLTD